MTNSLMNYSTLDYCFKETSEIRSLGSEARHLEKHWSG
jgi:hypothetical protein